MSQPTDHQLEIAAFRHRLIAAALEAEGRGISAFLKESAGRHHRGPGGAEASVALGTLWKWLATYRKGGLIALCPQPRKDLGILRAFAPGILETAMRLRQENPQRSTTTIIDIMEREEQVPVGSVARSTLDRHLDREDLSRRRLGTLAKQTFRLIQTDAPFALVMCDFHHGPHVHIGADGTTKRALFLGFIDHYSRFIPEGRYYLAEDFAALRFGFRHLILAHGLPVKLYMDNGSAFHSNRFHAACSLLGIHLIHSRPYQPEGRGLIERFNRTLKDQFESEVNCRETLPTLDELNAWLEAWLSERYHRTVHSETGESPEARFGGTVAGRPAPPPELVDEYLRLRETRTVHRKWSTVEVAGTRFLVHPSLRGRRVQVLYDPFDLAYVLVSYQDRPVERAKAQPANETPPQSEPAPAFQGPRTDYLGRIRSTYESRVRRELGSIQIRPVPSEQDLPGLTSLLESCRGTVLSDPERNEVSAFWRRLRPMDLDSTGRILGSAQRRLGVGLHLSVYLQALEDQLVRGRSTPKEAAPSRPKVKVLTRKATQGTKP